MSGLVLKDLAVEEARARILACAPAPRIETVALSEALGRVLAEDIIAHRDQPPFAASAMDGWAVAGPGTRLRIVGESAAGRGYRARLAPGEAVRIFTGAPVPDGAERVVIQELARRDGDEVVLEEATPGPPYVRAAGGDFKGGDRLLTHGARLDPWRLGLAAAAGRARLQVAARPRVVILATGEELVDGGETPGPDQIFNSGGPALSALIRQWGADPVTLAPAKDELEAITEAVSGAGGQVVVTLGGASVGDHDLVKPALARLGLALQVETVRLRPGKPTWFGPLADGRLVVGLPGNPASGLVCAELFLRPLLNAMQGAAPGPVMETARLTAPIEANGPREHWARARLTTGDGMLLASPMRDQDSSLVTVFAQADALMRRRAGAPAEIEGAVVDILRLGRL